MQCPYGIYKEYLKTYKDFIKIRLTLVYKLYKF